MDLFLFKSFITLLLTISECNWAWICSRGDRWRH